jgi:hypothetical protein
LKVLQADLNGSYCGIVVYVPSKFFTVLAGSYIIFCSEVDQENEDGRLSDGVRT